MDEKELRALVTSTGRELLSEGLVARTWGNISARLSENTFLITPSGLDYMQTGDDDLAVYDFSTDEWSGPYKPSSEKGVHKSAYEIFPEVEFVIHTHQTYASAIGVAGIDTLDITEEESESLGGIAEAKYGLPGTGTLKDAVKKAFSTGAHTVLMKNHGVVIAAESKEKAYERILLLEKVSKRSCRGFNFVVPRNANEKREQITELLIDRFPNMAWETSKETIGYSTNKRPLVAQLDDMAQMIGGHIRVCRADSEAIAKALNRTNALLIPGLGAIVNGSDKDDTEALKILVHKACVSATHSEALGRKRALLKTDVLLMNLVYKQKYSKKKNK